MAMKRILVLGVCLAAFAAAPPAWARTSGSIDALSGAVIIGRSDVNEIRAFPEMAATAEGRATAVSHPVLSMHATDAVYQSPLGYDDTVRYFDDQFAHKKLRVIARTVTETSTAWTVQRPDATVANIIVRTTTPRVTFEIAQVADDGRDWTPTRG